MVTTQELGQVAIFASLDEAARARLSMAAADISLMPGDYAANPGDDRALFAVLAGRIEPVQVTDGIERVVGTRLPGDIFGEFPLTFGTVFPVGFRAAEPSRVMRVEAADFHAIAAIAPDLAKEVGRLAAHRAGGLRGLRGLAADPPPPACDRDREPLRRRVHRAAAVPRAQSGHIQVADSRPAGGRRALGWTAAGRG